MCLRAPIGALILCTMVSACSLLQNYDDLVGEPREAGAAVDATSSCASCIDLEAESGALRSPMRLVTNPSASGGGAVVSDTEDQGSDELSFSVASAGVFLVWARVIAWPDTGSNSFYVSIDHGSENVYSMPLTQTFAYSRIDIADTSDAWVTRLEPGSHTILFRGRETGTILDKVIVTRDASFTPPGGTTSQGP
jgi:hypothetical protein